MKTPRCYILSALAIAMLTVIGCNANQEIAQSDSIEKIESTFMLIPDEQQLAVYWYWISDNISVEGAVKDLHAMKKAGINRAFIGNIGVPRVPYGEHKFRSEEWWNVVHAALKTATELDIEIGIFNSPGWSQSGGPWVKPEQSMRYLGSAETFVSGPMKYNDKLDPVAKVAQDVKVIAYPTIKQESHFEVSKSGKVIDLVSDKESVVRSLTITTDMSKKIDAMAKFQVKEGGKYRTICDVKVYRISKALNVGFDPDAPIVISIPETKGKEFRLELPIDADVIESVNLSDVPLVERYSEKSLAKMFQRPLPMWGEYMWEAQPELSNDAKIISQGDIIDLTDKMAADGTLNWDVPAGDWTIVRSAMVTTGVKNAPASPQAVGLETDKMSKEHIRSHFDAFIGDILEKIPAEDRKTFKVVVADSYETGGLNWTDSMMEDFIAAYSYDPTPFIPVLQGYVVDSPDVSDRFLWDLRRLVADKVSYDYVGGLREVANEHGLTTWLENYGHWGFPGEFLQYGGQSDEIAGEFWSVGSLGDIENRAASSCAHIYGKRKVWAESFTSGGPDFVRCPAEMKQRGDRFFTEGINATLLHLYVQQADDTTPGTSAPWGNEFNRNNTWFSQMDTFAKYLKRCNYMLQQGQYIADVAYFIGEDAPKMTGVCDPALPQGYSFDYINAEILMNNARVEGDKLVLDSGMEYKVLVLPNQTTIRPELLRKLKEFVSQGLVILGPAPTSSPSFENYPIADEQVKALAAQMWSEDSNFKGKVYSDVTLDHILAEQGVKPDFTYEGEQGSMLFIHHSLDDSEIYFVSNQTQEQITTEATFRVSGMYPELWNPQMVEVRKISDFEQKGGATSLSLSLKPLESCFVVFRKSPSEHGAVGYTEQLVKNINTPWVVDFQADRGAPSQSVTFEKLTDWSTHQDEGIKYFSGEASYKTTFALDKLPSEDLYIDLGSVSSMAKVSINGKEVGGVWTTPYRLNITDYVKVGDNALDIVVVNTWWNRIIGDILNPDAKSYTQQTFRHNRPDKSLQSSGLLGPVRVLTLAM